MEEQETQLTKQERRELAKEQRAEERAGTESRGQLTKWFMWLVIVGLVAGGGWWVWKEITRPAPAVLGESVEDIGRNHVPDGTVVEYNSNPPTSGNHYGEWTRAGVYGNPVSDGNLVHSLEHGYVIMSYNCADKESQECRDLVAKLTSVYEKRGRRKLIVIPRPNLDTKIALTAWGRIYKSNPSAGSELSEAEQQRIGDFIELFRDKGPEKTAE